MTSGCATHTARSWNYPPGVYPATRLDAYFFWTVVVRNEPIDDGWVSRPDIVGRMAYGGMTIIDLPFSIVSDTILLPADLFRADTAKQRVEIEAEQ